MDEVLVSLVDKSDSSDQELLDDFPGKMGGYRVQLILSECAELLTNSYAISGTKKTPEMELAYNASAVLYRVVRLLNEGEVPDVYRMENITDFRRLRSISGIARIPSVMLAKIESMTHENDGCAVAARKNLKSILDGALESFEYQVREDPENEQLTYERDLIAQACGLSMFQSVDSQI